MRHAVVCSVRNEGPNILEWVAWQQMLGFTDIVILTNDCTDHSVELLDLLAAEGVLTHVPVAIPEDELPTPAKLRVAKAHPVVLAADWAFLCDIDEFLVLKDGLTLGELWPEEADFIGMSVNWRVFGTSGRERWEDGLTHRLFTRSGGPRHPTGRWVKSACRRLDAFKRWAPHAAVGLIDPDLLARWGTGEARWVGPGGEPLRSYAPDGPVYRMMDRDEFDTSRVQINHYMMRSEESYALKVGTPSPASGRDRYRPQFRKNFNRNEVEDLSAFGHEGAFDIAHQRLLRIPGVVALHHLCCADYVARLAAKAGRRPEDDPRWQSHMELATSLGAAS